MTTYAAWDPDNKSSWLTLSNGNLTFTGAGGWNNAKADQGKTSGKWYFEVTFSVQNSTLGVCDADYSHTNHIGAAADSFGMYINGGNGTVYNEGTGISNYLTGLPTSNCVIGVAVDLDNSKIWFRGSGGYGNPGGGVGDPANGTNPAGTLDTGYAFYPAAGSRAETYTVTINTGESAFSYSAPSGFNAGWYEGDAEQTALEDIRLNLETYGQGLADLATLLEAAFLLGLEDLPLGLQTWGQAITDLSLPLQAAALGVGDVPLGLAAIAGLRRDVNLSLAAVSPEVLRSLGLYLSATDGVRRQDMALVLDVIQKAPTYRAVIAQRLTSVMREVV